jgi:hypothetical protein
MTSAAAPAADDQRLVFAGGTLLFGRLMIDALAVLD